MAGQVGQERRSWFPWGGRSGDGRQAGGVFGRARWARDAGAAGDVDGEASGPFVGWWRSGTGRDPVLEPMHYTGDGHLLLVAPSRSGKARDVAVPSLLTNRDSAVVIDVKGELAAITAPARREMGHRVYCLNPFGLHTGPPWHLPRHGFNPLRVLEPDSPGFASDVESLAGALIQHDAQEAAHWSEGAKALVAGLIVQEVLSPARNGVPALEQVRAYLTMGDREFEDCMAAIVQKTPSALVRDRLTSFTSLTNELRSLRSTARVQTAFLSDPQIAEATRQHDFSYTNLKRRDTPMTVYVMLPSRLIARGMTYNRYLRLCLQAALDAMTATPRQHSRPVWFLIDEFYSLGPMPAVERMMSEGAGYGIQLQPIVQSLGQMKELYRANWETFIANAAVQQWFAPRDYTTAEYISKMLGQFTANTETINPRGERSLGETGRPLLRPEEVMQMTEEEQFVLLKGYPNPLRLKRSPYFKTPGLSGKYAPNPYFVE